MGKIFKKENWRVVVWPRSIGDYGFFSISDYAVEPDEDKRNERYRSICKDIARDIKRHVDDVGGVHIICDQVAICEYCGNDWEVNDDPDDPDFALGEPMCCIEAQKEWRENAKVEI